MFQPCYPHPDKQCLVAVGPRSGAWALGGWPARGPGSRTVLLLAVRFTCRQWCDRSCQDAIKGTGHPAILDDVHTSIYSIAINSRSHHRVVGHAITTESASSKCDRNTLATAHNEALCVKRLSEVSLWLLAWSSGLCRGRARGRRVVAGRSPAVLPGSLSVAAPRPGGCRPGAGRRRCPSRSAS
jgi:hypothetical protein